MSDFSKDQFLHMQEHISEVAQPLLDMWWKKLREQAPKIYHEALKSAHTTVSVHEPDTMNCSGVYFGIGHCLHFIISRYPSCCSTSILHKFSYHGSLQEVEEVLPEMTKIIDACFEGLSSDVYLKSGRTQIMMVEVGTRAYPKRDKYEVVPNIGNDEVRKNLLYPLFWDYFQSKHIESHRAHVNPNGGRIIHNLEVLIK